MIATVEAMIDEQGRVGLLESIRLPAVRRALVTILEEAPLSGVSETALVSEAALARDWDRPEEDAAWSHLQSAQQYMYTFHSWSISCDLGRNRRLKPQQTRNGRGQARVYLPSPVLLWVHPNTTAGCRSRY